MRFREAVAFAYAMDWPLNIGFTITWTALETAGERNEGHCLGRSEWGREKYTRDELARLCRSEGLPFVCLLYTSPSPRDRTRSRMPSSA